MAYVEDRTSGTFGRILGVATPAGEWYHARVVVSDPELGRHREFFVLREPRPEGGAVLQPLSERVARRMVQELLASPGVLELRATAAARDGDRIVHAGSRWGWRAGFAESA